MPEQKDPNSWTDNDGRSWCYSCEQMVWFFKEGWICSLDCPVYIDSDTDTE